jgi:WD40 repeat protein
VLFNGDGLTLDGVDYGDLKPGDRVRLSAEGMVFINDQPTGPHPIRPKRVDPPATDIGPVNESVLALAWVSDRRLVTASADRKILGWDVGKPDPVFAVNVPEKPNLMAVSPDGKWLAAAGLRGEIVYLWDFRNGTSGDSIRLADPHGPVHGLAFLNNQWLVEARGKEVYARQIDKAGARPVAIGPVHDGSDRAVAVSGNGQIVARLEQNEQLSLMHAAQTDGVPVPAPGISLTGFGYDAGPALNRDGSRLFANRNGFRDQNVARGLYVFETTGGTPVSRLRWRSPLGLVTQVQCAAFSPDNSLLAVGEVESLRVYDVATGRERAWFGATPRRDFNDMGEREIRWCYAAAFSPDGKYLAAGFSEGQGPRLRVWETAAFLDAPAK